MVVVGLPLAGGRFTVTPASAGGPALEKANPGRISSDAAETAPDLRVALRPAAFGKSGALWTMQALPGATLEVPIEWGGKRPAAGWYHWVPVGKGAGKAATRPGAATFPLGSSDDALRAPVEPGTYHLVIGAGEQSRILDELTLIVQVPLQKKQGTHLRGYHIGRFPTEGQGRTDRYAPPAGFIEVTRQNQSLQLSRHFRIREFLTKDQHDVWPKYVVVDPRLLEKLELVMQELNAMGVRADRMHVMSGFRTPQYNARGLGQGRADLSRHQFGDAADVWIDNDGNGYMDDLNGDGKRDTGDVRVMLKAVERVEARHPELVGGAGIYAATSAHGPFIHIDVRGKKARW
jgi:uncharacterized protein YcbK (DUF882 family)